MFKNAFKIIAKNDELNFFFRKPQKSSKKAQKRKTVPTILQKFPHPFIRFKKSYSRFSLKIKQ